MSLVTSCPQCATIFVVRPEQLAAQKGKVRCGHCQQVFNALDSLQEPVSNASAAESTLPFGSIAETIVDATPDKNSAGEIDNGVSSTPPDAALQEAEAVSEVNTAPEPQTELKQDIAELPVPDPADPSIHQPIQPSIDAPEKKAASRLGNRTSKAQPSALADVEIEGKLQQIRRRKVNKVSLILLCLILVLAAALQSIYFMRTTIISQWPVLKPDFIAACKFLGCTVELAANADLLTVDDSDLHEDTERPGLIRLSTTLINNAAFRQRYPLLELTLTDANETPMLRRTFKPAEYLPPSSNISNGLSAGEEIRINLALISEEKSVSGYRVYITY